MGLARLDKVAQAHSLEVDRQPFLLSPDKPLEGEPRRLFDGETETELSPAAQERARVAGVVMRRPAWSPNTMLVHQATLYAKDNGMDDVFHHAAARAYWEQGVDLGDLNVVLDIAKECGLDRNDMSVRLEAGHYRQQVLDEYERAKGLGVGGTPTYHISGNLLPGDVSYEALEEAVQGAERA
ncbi:MAG: DsbA family protein [Dehalococcoidia bacterium]|nr:DsbA family protein [Dehalococcoidia bacterium]